MEGDPDSEISICFLCLNSVKVAKSDLNSSHGDENTGSNPGQVSQTFLLFTENQLGLPLKDFFLDVEQFGNGFCGECSNVVGMVCSLYDDLCSVQVRLKGKVDQLLDLLEKSSIKNKYNDSEEDTEVDMGIRDKGHFKEVVEKRSQLKQYCQRYCQATGKSIHVPESFSEGKAEENVEIKSEIDSLIGAEDENENECTSLQNEMETPTETTENGSDVSSVQNAESPFPPAETEEDDDAEDFATNNSDSDWNEESETENDNGTSSYDSETENSEDNSNEEFEDTDRKTKKKEPTKIKTANNEDNLEDLDTLATLNDTEGEDSIYKCDKCGKPYVSKGYLGRHLRTVHGIRKSRHITCDLCGKEFSQKHCLMRHKDSKHNGSPEPQNAMSHSCTKCDQSFQRKGYLDKHMFRIHGIGSMKSFIYTCNLCGKGFNIKGNLKRHQRWSHKIKPTGNQTPFFCETCQRFFKTSKSLREHKQRTHKEMEMDNDDGTFANHSETNNDNSIDFEDKNSEKKELPKTKTIKIVRITEKEAEVPEATSKDNLEDSIYKCDKCGKPYISQGYLDRHLRTVHGLGKRHHVTCNLCGKEFSHHSSLMCHKDIKHNGNPEPQNTIRHTCNKCDQSFQRKGYLDKHMIQVHGIGSMKSFEYNCNLCGKGFNIKGSFTRHQRWGHKINRSKSQTPFVCEICQRFFKTSKLLREHSQLMHEEIKVSSTSNDNYSLEQHVNLVHQSKMKVGCSKCSMKFDTRRQLIHHKYSVHKKDEITVSFMKRLESAKGNINDEVKENCVVCNEEFSSWEVLRSHLKIHEDEISGDEKSLKCFKCDKMFAYEQTIWAHLRSSKRHDYTSIEFPCDHGDHLGYSQWVFQSPSLLENHFKEEHQDCGILKCEQCGWPFLDKNMLDIHRLLHIPRTND